jgi:hypothetical protein
VVGVWISLSDPHVHLGGLNEILRKK